MLHSVLSGAIEIGIEVVLVVEGQAFWLEAGVHC